jgi:hypothetical protein
MEGQMLRALTFAFLLLSLNTQVASASPNSAKIWPDDFKLAANVTCEAINTLDIFYVLRSPPKYAVGKAGESLHAFLVTCSIEQLIQGYESLLVEEPDATGNLRKNAINSLANAENAFARQAILAEILKRELQK